MPLLILPKIFGVSVEVYVIVGVLYVPFYFAIRWLLRKRIADPSKRKLAAAGLSLLVAPIFYIGVVALLIFYISWYPERDFDHDEWLVDAGHRYEYAHDIMESKLLLGLTHEQVVDMLGEPETDGEVLTYCLGYRPGLFNIDPDYLEIEFTKAHVSFVHVHTG